MDRIESTILSNLVYNEKYCRKVLPVIKPEYSNEKTDRVIFDEICKFVVKYGNMATKEILNIELENRRDLSDSDLKTSCDVVTSLEDKESNYDWLVTTTEKWCRDRAIYLALLDSVHLLDDENNK